jgi:hypothetical protein
VVPLNLNAVTLYPLIPDPPVVSGGSQLAVAEIIAPSVVKPGAAGTIRAGPGMFGVVTAADQTDGSPAPTAFVALTLTR